MNEEQLAIIEREVRNCFLHEDAPEYLSAFAEALQQLTDDVSVDRLDQVYQNMMRTAHSLKGGAAIAKLPNLSKLAHQLESSIEVLTNGKIIESQLAYELLFAGIEAIELLVNASIRGGEEEEAQEAEKMTIFSDLERFLAELVVLTDNKTTETTLKPVTSNHAAIQTALSVDLEDCLQRLEISLQNLTEDTSLVNMLKRFVEESNLLGQVFNLPWLIEASQSIAELMDAKADSVVEIVNEIIAYIRQQRDLILNVAPPPIVEDDRSLDIPASTILAFSSLNTSGDLKLRMSVSRLNRLNNTFGELLIDRERLSLQQKQLARINRTLKKQLEQFAPINEQIKSTYDNLAISDRSCTNTNNDFDSLELDRYTDLHSNLQDLQSLIAQLQESRLDIDTIVLEFQESLDGLRQKLNNLKTDLIDSRFVPFSTLTDRFSSSLLSLNSQYGKSVELKVEGKDTLIDRGILEQITTPLTHLFRNAFDHGIELPSERVKQNKPSTATILISASIQENQAIISIIDDGHGINLQKVSEKAVQKGLCASQNINELSREQILAFLFVPGFSTANTVTSLSGRGVGLDIVRLQIERLRGSIEIETYSGIGTKFILKIPLNISVESLLLCRANQKTLAIPTHSIVEIISISEFGKTQQIHWRDRSIPLYSLSELLPYTEVCSDHDNSSIALIVNISATPFAIAVDELIAEQELAIKPFDGTVKIPSYLTGCTVLGTGEVVPVIAFDRLSSLLHRSSVIKQNVTDCRQSICQERMRIAIVEDSIAVRRMLDRCLTESGYQVVQCKDGKEAISLLTRSSEKFNLVISDIEMPCLDGFELLQEIRSHSQWYNLPVVMLTSRDNDKHRQKAIGLGANAYFTKPFAKEELLRAIANILE